MTATQRSSDRSGLASDAASALLADPRAIKHGHVACPRVAAGASRPAQAYEVRLAAHEQIDAISHDVPAGVIGHHAAVMDVASPGSAARHQATLEQRHVE